MTAYRQIYEQFFEEASFLWNLRTLAVDQPHYTLPDLFELEQRIEANLDGLTSAIDSSWELCEEGLERAQPGEVFTAAIVALRSHDIGKIQRVVEFGFAEQQTRPGLLSALGWLPPTLVHDWIKKFLHSKNLDHKYLAIAACSVRRENPGEWLSRILQREDCRAHPALYQRALRLIGELRRHDLADLLAAAANEKSEEPTRFWALWSQAMLGNTGLLVDIESYALSAGPLQRRAMALLIRTLPLPRAQRLISQLAQQSTLAREVIIGSGMLGDPHAVEWLIAQMQNDTTARLAGEAFTHITGIELESQQLTREAPADLAHQPNDDPADEDASMDDDEHLPWPQAGRVKAYWNAHGQRFIGGQRYFHGQPISAAWLKQQLPLLTQRLRHSAALELAILDTAAPYLNTRARA